MGEKNELDLYRNMILKVLKDEDGKTLSASCPVHIREHPSMPLVPSERAAQSRSQIIEPKLQYFEPLTQQLCVLRTETLGNGLCDHRSRALSELLKISKLYIEQLTLPCECCLRRKNTIKKDYQLLRLKCKKTRET